MQNRPTSWTRGIVWFGAATSAVILILLTISLGTTYTTSKRQLAHQYQEVEPITGLNLEIIYPEQLLVDAAADLMLNLTVVDSSHFIPLTVSLDLPSGIIISGTVKNQAITLSNSFDDSFVNLPGRMESVSA